MTDRIKLTEFITLGQRLYILMNPSGTNARIISEEAEGLLASLQACNLTRSFDAAGPFRGIHSYRYFERTGVLTPMAAAQVKSYAEAVFHAVYSEAGATEVSAINLGAASAALRTLDGKLTLNETQRQLLNEATLCLEAGAYRAASVMGWNLAYDVIRRWVFDNQSRRDAFNDALTTKYTKKSGQPVFERIDNYEEFFSGHPGEWTVIEACSLAGLFGGGIRDELWQCLRKRNNYAHPSFRVPSADQAKAYIKDLIDIITGPPFKT